MSAIDPADGIDDSEAAAFDAALGDDEDLVVGLLNRMSDAQIDRVLADADPRATAVLGRPAESDDFTTVGNSL